MDTVPIECILNSISRFLHLVSCQTIKYLPIQKRAGNMVLVLKLFKALLDEIADRNPPYDEFLCKECEELDVAVNAAREFLENCSPKTSKIWRVFQCENLLGKILTSSLGTCKILLELSQASPSTLRGSVVKLCMQEIEALEQERTLIKHIEEALRGQRGNISPSMDHLINITVELGLTSNQELLKESINIEKERINIQADKSKEKSDRIEQLVDLISCVREYRLRMEFLEAASGVLVPPYFRCPLSLELMLDPVIVASGQTYDRASIQEWINNGLTICPKTRQVLTHMNLIPNHTFKAMIASWCQSNNVRVFDNLVSGSSQSDDVSLSHDLLRTESFRCSLRSSSFTSRSSFEIGNGFEKLRIDTSSGLGTESDCTQNKDLGKFIRASPEQSYTHSRSESVSSAVSSVDYVPSLSNEGSSVPRDHCEEVSTELDDLVTTSLVKKLVEDLKNGSNKVQTVAAAELRHLAKHNMENRSIICRCGAISPLISLLFSKMKLTQEHAVTALLNLSINEENKAKIAKAGALEPLVHVLNTGNDGARENSAATLFSLSALQEYRAIIGRSGAVKALVNLLGNGTLRGKKDSITALFNLSIFHENKPRIVQAGAVKHLVKLMDPDFGMVDKSVALLANLATVGEGRAAIEREDGIPFLVQVLDYGSQRGKENAASALLQLCLNSTKFCTLVLQEGSIPLLVALSQFGTPRAKEKAQQLLSHFRSQREASMKKSSRS